MNKLTFIAILLVVLLISGGLSVGFFFLGAPRQYDERIDFDTYQSYNQEFIQNINAEIISGDLKVIKGEGNNITTSHKGFCEYHYFGKQEEKEEPTLEVALQEEELQVLIRDTKFNLKRFFTNCESELIITIPENKQLDKVQLESVSGDILLDIAPLKTLYVETVSGEININSKATAVRSQSVSGNIVISQADDINHESVSGNIVVFSLETGEFETISGNVELDLAPEQTISFDTVSGQLQGKTQRANNAKINIETMSGNVVIN